MNRRVWKLILSSWICLISLQGFSQAVDSTFVANPSGYLLLDKGLQYRITKSINSMYNFDFPTAERDFAVIMYQYPEHPLPDFLIALGYWWRIEVDVTNTRFDNIFIQYYFFSNLNKNALDIHTK